MTIASMMLCGLIMGMAFDVYRVASHRYQVARWLLPALDLAFWAAATLTVFGILLRNNEGEVRMYVFLGLGIGVTGYFGLFSQWIVKLAGKLIDAINSMFRFLWKLVNALIWTPFLWIVRLLAKLLDIAFVVTAALLLWVFRLVFKPIAVLANWIWPKTLPIRRKFDPMVQAYGRVRGRLREIRDILKKKPK